MFLSCCEVYFTEVDFLNTLSVVFISGMYKKLQKKKCRESTFNNKIPSESNLVQSYSLTFLSQFVCQIFLFSLEFPHKPLTPLFLPGYGCLKQD